MIGRSKPYYQVKHWPKGMWADEDIHYFPTEYAAVEFAKAWGTRGHHYLVTLIQEIESNFA